MASRNIHSAAVVETCTNCGSERPHDVSIDLLTESSEEENAEFSREPYRIVKCHGCGTTTKTRINNA